MKQKLSWPAVAIQINILIFNKEMGDEESEGLPLGISILGYKWVNVYKLLCLHCHLYLTELHIIRYRVYLQNGDMWPIIIVKTRIRTKDSLATLLSNYVKNNHLFD